MIQRALHILVSRHLSRRIHIYFTQLPARSQKFISTPAHGRRIACEIVLVQNQNINQIHRPETKRITIDRLATRLRSTNGNQLSITPTCNFRCVVQ